MLLLHVECFQPFLEMFLKCGEVGCLNGVLECIGERSVLNF